MAQTLDREFANRFAQGMDRAPGVPAAQHGRLTWLKRQIQQKHGDDLAVETIRKWSKGMVRPRDNNLRVLAEIFGVDQTWLAFGEGPVSTRAEKKTITQKSTGAVHFVAGAMMMAGLNVAFPREGDEIAREHSLDLYVIKDGEQRTVTVCQVHVEDGGKAVAHTPYPLRCTDLILVMPTESETLVYQIDPKTAEKAGARKNDFFEVPLEVGTRSALVIGDYRIEPSRTMHGF